MTQNTNTTERQEQHKIRRNELKALSKTAKLLMKADCEGMTVNEILVAKFYRDSEHREFKTLHEWNKDGFQILKGSKSFLVWGKPTRLQKEEVEPNDEEDDFYPLCYLFSNAQVQKRDAKK